MYGETGTLYVINMKMFRDAWCLEALKVMMKVLVFLLLPESSLNVMFVMSETPWGFSSRVGLSCLSQSTSGPHRMTPLHEFRVL